MLSDGFTFAHLLIILFAILILLAVVAGAVVAIVLSVIRRARPKSVDGEAPPRP
jgi:hypothetical protein